MKELQTSLQSEFAKLETTWHAPRAGASEATRLTLDRLHQGETILFEPNEAIYNMIHDHSLVGQFDLGFQLSGKERGYPLLHVTKGSN